MGSDELSERTIKAHREAAHAVAAVLHGATFERASLDDDPMRWSRAEVARAQRFARAFGHPTPATPADAAHRSSFMVAEDEASGYLAHLVLGAIRRAVAVTVAGMWAEWRLKGLMTVYWRRDAPDLDREPEQLLDALIAWPTSGIRYYSLVGEARELVVDEAWPTIERVARTLLERGALTEDEVADLVFVAAAADDS